MLTGRIMRPKVGTSFRHSQPSRDFFRMRSELDPNQSAPKPRMTLCCKFEHQGLRTPLVSSGHILAEFSPHLRLK